MAGDIGCRRGAWPAVLGVLVGVTGCWDPPPAPTAPDPVAPPASGHFRPVLPGTDAPGPGPGPMPNPWEPCVDDDDIVSPEPCDAIPLPGGEVLTCSDLFDPETYCAHVFDNVPGDGLLVLGACAACDPLFLTIADEVTCGPTPLPDIPPPAPPPGTCTACHAPAGYDGAGSLGDPHPYTPRSQPMRCVTCHGGDDTETNPFYAHVCPPPAVGNRQDQVLDPRAFFLANTLVGVATLPNYTCPTSDGGTRTVTATDWLAFQDPGDLHGARAGKGCGTCHGPSADEEGLAGGDIVTPLWRSVMAQNTGIFTGARHGAGIENAFHERRGLDANGLADLGVSDVDNPDFDPVTRLVGEIGSLQANKAISTGAFLTATGYAADDVSTANNTSDPNADNFPNGTSNEYASYLYQEILTQACSGCHLQNRAGSTQAGAYRRSGCSACHARPSMLGRFNGHDPMVSTCEPLDPNFLTPGEHAHALDHRGRSVATLPQGPDPTALVAGVGDDSCLLCHQGSNHTVFQYRGWRLDENQDLTNAAFYPRADPVAFTNVSALFGENQFYIGRHINQWIATEIWEQDVADLRGQAGQDSTPADAHHDAGLGCVDCHTTGATHGRGRLFSRMRDQTHAHDVSCETCHGTIDAYAATDGVHPLTQDGAPLDHIFVEGDPQQGDLWLVSKLNATLHYVPQVKDVVDTTSTKLYPPGATRQGPMLNRVASAAMGRADDAGDGSDGTGPLQPHWPTTTVNPAVPFAHSDGVGGTAGQGLACITCHASWQNNCMGCHLDAAFDDRPDTFLYSLADGERAHLQVSPAVRYQNPVDFILGVGDRGRIVPYFGLHRFWSYTDRDNNTSLHIATGDRNGLGDDPGLRDPNRHTLPALGSHPFTPHTVRGRPTMTAVGPRQCLNCHLPHPDDVYAHDQDGTAWSGVADYIANTADYARAIPFNVRMAYGLGSGLWLADANGDFVVDSNNPPVYDLDRIVEENGASNAADGHPLLDPFAINPRYLDPAGTNHAGVARPLTATVLARLQALNAVGLTDIYVRNLIPGQDPATTHAYAYDASFKDIGYVGQ